MAGSRSDDELWRNRSMRPAGSAASKASARSGIANVEGSTRCHADRDFWNHGSRRGLSLQSRRGGSAALGVRGDRRRQRLVRVYCAGSGARDRPHGRTSPTNFAACARWRHCQSRRRSRQGRAGQLLGDVVRAVQVGDASAAATGRPAARGALHPVLDRPARGRRVHRGIPAAIRTQSVRAARRGRRRHTYLWCARPARHVRDRPRRDRSRAAPRSAAAGRSRNHLERSVVGRAGADAAGELSAIMAHPESPFLALRERAVAFLKSAKVANEDALLGHVYGGAPPAALRERLLEPLRDDPRLHQLADGQWTLRAVSGRHVSVADAELTALAVTTTGSRPSRARVVRIAALHVQDGDVIERFSALVNPGRRVPRYVLARAGVGPDFAEPLLLDVNELANRLLDLPGKPTLGLVAQRLGLSFTRLEQADEEARVISAVVPELLRRAAERGLHELGELRHTPQPTAALRRGATARELPDQPGVYVMRDAQQAPLYVGKARRLRARVAAYVHRPLGATRRLEGLAEAVEGLAAHTCETDLEALVLEDREIRRLQPRFNTVRQQRAPRTWLRLPPQPLDPKRAPARLELASGPTAGAGDYLGPFRNEALAESARMLTREVLDLDRLRRHDRQRYVEQLARAWAFLGGSIDDALAQSRAQHALAVSAGDLPAARRWQRRLS